MKVKIIILLVASCVVMCVAMSKGEPANLRVGIFSEDGFPDGAGVRPTTWYQDELKKLGYVPVVLNADDMSNVERLNRKVLDVLILPNGDSIPYEAAYLIPKFLMEGGHLITTRLPMVGYKNDPSKPSKWMVKAQISGQSRYPMALQIRFVSWKSAQRSLKTELKVNTNLMASVSARLPTIAAPLNASVGLPDKWNMIQDGKVDGKREPRDFDAGGDYRNIETAGNILLPIYCLPTGEPADFLAYRYHNNYYNGSTLVHLGQVGESLMKGDKAGDILWSCLMLCAERYPGEQSAAWYERLIEVQRKISEYGKIFIGAYYKARDGMIAVLYTEDREAYYGMKGKMRELMDGLEAVMKGKQTLDKLLAAETDYDGQEVRRKALLERIEAEEQKCGEALAAVVGLPVSIKEPEKVKVRYALGGIPVEAGLAYPSLYELRTDMLQTMKELGCNVWCFQYPPFYWFLDDPSSKPLMEGINGLDVWNMDARILVGGSNGLGDYVDYEMVLSRQGKLDILTGQVEETPREARQPEKLEKRIREYVARGRPYPIIRYYGGSESGLGNNYWGEQAREEYIEHLKEKYMEVRRLNERWLTAYTNFNDIKLITRQPETVSEHANWEDWRKFRELQLFKAKDTVYRLFKKYAPNVFYSSCISASEGLNYPTYGVDYYELTKAQDISGIDGTACRQVSREWTYLDLIADGKKVWTMEWGAFYYPPADILEGRKRLLKQLWQEVSGGHIGINCWIWRWPGFPGNYVDTTGLPTQYGWELKQLVSDFRKIEHILLDGKRVEPEIRILFSNTTRSHDQTWKYVAVSLHLATVDRLYDHFLKLKFAARVLDEGALRDGVDLSKCRMLIVPQAQYLSREIQDKLLDYARSGGCLVIEGWSGKYDNYGNSSNNMFRALGVVPGTVRTKKVQLMAGVFYEAQDKKYQELFYAPASVKDAKIIINYESGEPAIISMGCGKGKVIMSGLSFSALELKGTELIMKELFKEAELMLKYQCDDEALIVREWEYDNELYLICAYPDGKELANRYMLKVRGEWNVEDYMLGVKIPVEQDGAYTKFEGVILSPGGRAYRLKSRLLDKPVVPALSKAEGSVVEPVEVPVVGRQDKMAGVLKDMKQPVKTEKINQSDMSRSLPYKGELQVQDGEVVLGGYTFQVAVVNSGGEWNEKGRVFLTVRRSEEERIQELKLGAEALFVFRDKALRVKCENHHYVYPEGATVAIEAVKRPKIGTSECGITTNGAERGLSNGMVSLKVLPEEGGKIVELKTWPEGINHVAKGGIKEHDGEYPGNLMNQRFMVEREAVTPEECCVVLGMAHATGEGLKERKGIRLKQGMAWTGISLELRNEGDRNWAGSFHVHPELNVGGIADENDVFYVPEKDGITAIQYSAGDRYLCPTEGWTACCDVRERLVYVSKFNLDKVKTVYLYFGDNWYNMELWSPKAVLKKGESLRVDHEICMVKGVSGVGGYGQGWVGNLIMPAGKWPQDKKMKLILEIGNAYLEKRSARVRVALRRAGKEVRMYYDGKVDVGYEKGLEKEIEAGFDGLAEGEYKLEAWIGTDTAEILTIRKNVILLGKKIKEDLAVCKAYQERLDAYKKDLDVTREQKFNAVMILEELKTAVERQDDEVIRRKREALEKILNFAR